MNNRGAIQFLILMSLVSLCADAPFEGIRSLLGLLFWQLLSPPGTIILFLGELINYWLTVKIGFSTDRRQQYWNTTTRGYSINTFVICLLALGSIWSLDLTVLPFFLVLERIGKALRTPPTDVLISHAAFPIGKGLFFGLHVAMSQIGALVAPLLLVGALSHLVSPLALVTLPILTVLGLVVLFIARWCYPNPREFEQTVPSLEQEGMPRHFRTYMLGVALLVAGFIDFPLIILPLGYLTPVSTEEGITKTLIVYGIARGVQAVASPILGWLFDWFGIPVLIFAVVISSQTPLLIFRGYLTSDFTEDSHSFPLLLLGGIILWGISKGAQDSILKAIISGMVPANRRGSAYGIFNTTYRIARVLGSVYQLLLYQRENVLIFCSMGLQLLAVPFLLRLR